MHVHTQVSSNWTNPTKTHACGPFGFVLLQAPCLASQKNKINSRYWLAQAYQNIYKCIWQFTYVSPRSELSQTYCQCFCVCLYWFLVTALRSPPRAHAWRCQKSQGSSRAALCCVTPDEFIAAIFPGEGIVKACWEASQQCIFKAISWHLTRNTNPTQFSLLVMFVFPCSPRRLSQERLLSHLLKSEIAACFPSHKCSRSRALSNAGQPASPRPIPVTCLWPTKTESWRGDARGCSWTSPEAGAPLMPRKVPPRSAPAVPALTGPSTGLGLSITI